MFSLPGRYLQWQFLYKLEGLASPVEIKHIYYSVYDKTESIVINIQNITQTCPCIMQRFLKAVKR